MDGRLEIKITETIVVVCSMFTLQRKRGGGGSNLRLPYVWESYISNFRLLTPIFKLFEIHRGNIQAKRRFLRSKISTI